MRLDNLPTGVFTAGPAPKVQKSPRLLRKMRALLFRLRVLFPAWDVPPSFFCRSAARAVPSRFPAALPAPWIPPRPRFRSAPGTPPLPRCSAAGASFMAAAGGEHTTPTSGGWNSAGGPCACGERLPPHILPNLSATIPLPGFPSAFPFFPARGRHRARLPVRAGHVQKYTAFSLKKP